MSDPATDANRAMAASGPPTATWSILLELELHDSLNVDRLQEAARDLADQSRLGPTARVICPEREDWENTLHRFSSERFRRGDSILRLAALDNRLLIAAHHGAVDGIGLLGVAGKLTETKITSSARGRPDEEPVRVGLREAARHAVRRVALPPQRLARDSSHRKRHSRYDTLASTTLESVAHDTATWAAAVSRAAVAHNRIRRRSTRGMEIAIGVSLRPGTDPTVEDQSGFLRLRPREMDEVGVRERLKQAKLAGGGASIPYWASRSAAAVLSRRLGPSILLSNLGSVYGEGLGSVRFFPVSYGRSSVAVGVCSLENTCTVTARARSWELDENALGMLLDDVARYPSI